MSDRRLHWGILGTGNIASQFAAGLTRAQRGRVVAVGSRAAESAQAFAARFGLTPHASYDALLRDPAVEALYLSLPNSMHHEWTLKALHAGKHVLCEKPFALTEAQGRECFELAGQRKLTLVEAFMYRSHPQTHALLRHIAAGDIGRVKLLRASFCFRTTKPQGNIRFNASLAGGALLDVGCYCIDLARLVLGEEPATLHVASHFHDSGVDDLSVGSLTFPSGAALSFACGMLLHTDNALLIGGDEGYLHVPVPWKPPEAGAVYTLAQMPAPRMDSPARGAPPRRETFTINAGKPLYALEADDFAATVLDGTPPRVPARDTLANLRILEQLRRQAGIPAPTDGA